MQQKDLAERLMVSKPYISQILAGKSNMTIETLVKLADSLEMEVNVGLSSKEEMATTVSVSAVTTAFSTNFLVMDSEAANWNEPFPVAKKEKAHEAIA